VHIPGLAGTCASPFFRRKLEATSADAHLLKDAFENPRHAVEVSIVTIPVRGTAALLTAALIVVITLVWLPAYRLFFAISVGIGLVVAGALYLWHKFRPVREQDVHNKRPLGLD
jgi:hypothetical protein